MDVESQNPFESPHAIGPADPQEQRWDPDRQVASAGGLVVWVVGLMLLITTLVWWAG